MWVYIPIAASPPQSNQEKAFGVMVRSYYLTALKSSMLEVIGDSAWVCCHGGVPKGTSILSSLFSP